MDAETRRSTLVRIGSYAGEQAIRLGLTAVAGVFVARHLGPDGLGLLAYVASIFGLLTPLVSLGLPAVLVREFGTTDRWRTVLASVVVPQLVVAAAVAIVAFLAVGASRGWDDQAVLTALVLVPLPFLYLDRTVRAYLESRGSVRVIVTSGLVGGVTGTVLKLLGVVASADVWVIAAASTIEAAVIAWCMGRALPGRRSLGGVLRHADPKVSRALRNEGLPLLLAGVAVTVYMRIDTTMLGLLVGDEETGIYTAAVRLSEVWYFLPMAAVAALRPRLTALLAGDEQQYERLLQRLMTAAVAVAYVVVAVVLLVGDDLIAFLYGEGYAASAPVLSLHVLAAPFVFVGVTAGPWFIDNRLGRAVLVRSAAGAGLNIALNVALLPALGAVGAAIATLASYALSGVLFNVLRPSTRPIFRLQVRALALRWQ